MLPTLFKAADLKPDVQLQPHQQHIEDLAEDHPLRLLLVHGLGTGKSLSGLAAAEAFKKPYTVIAPASLRPNYVKEREKFTDQKTPADVISYNALAQGMPVSKPESLIFDEFQRASNPDSKQTQRAIELADKAKQVMLLSATPITNRAGDLSTALRVLTGKAMTPDEFEAHFTQRKDVYPNLVRRIVGWPNGQEYDIAHRDELKGLLKGHVDWHVPERPVVPTQHQDIPVEMSPEQATTYEAMFAKLPWWAKHRLRNNVALNDDELTRLVSFLTGPRQIGLSDYPYSRNKDPIKSFEGSPKLQAAFNSLNTQLKDPRSKALVFSNFIDAGLTPYAAALQRAGIPHGIFHGGLTDKDRRHEVEEYNNGRKRVMLLGPSGTEGLSFKGTQLTQLLDPHWHSIRGTQSVGRGLRFDSHTGLPADLQTMKVERYLSRLPKSTVDKLMEGVGFDRTHKTLGTDDRLTEISKNKEVLNQRFMDLLKEVGTGS